MSTARIPETSKEPPETKATNINSADTAAWIKRKMLRDTGPKMTP